MTNDQLAELRAAASTAHNDIIRSHGWNGFVEELDALAKDEAYLLLASPETMLALLDNIDAKTARIAELEQDAARYAALRHALINVDPKGNRGPIEMAIKNLIRQVHAERGVTEPTEDEFDAAIDATMTT